MLPSEELIAAFLIGFALGTLVRNEQLKKATEQRDRAENMLRNVSKEYTNLGNGINHELCMKFVKSGYDLKVIEESV